MRKNKRLSMVLLTLLLSSAFSLPSYADDSNNANVPKPKKHRHNVAYNNLTNNFESTVTNKNIASTTPNPWAAMVAVGTGIAPKYPGSNTMIGASAVAFNVAYKNRFFITSSQGVGVNVINTEPFIVGTSVNYSYNNNFRSKQFSGLDNPKDAFVGSVFANYTVDLFNFGLTAYKTIGQLEGAGYYQANVTRAVPITKRLVVNLNAAAQYDDARYMQSLYGVTASESATSGLPVYNTQSGWDNVSYAITPMYSINKHWILTGSLAGISYVNEVAQSPLIKHKQNYAAMIGVIYNIF